MTGLTLNKPAFRAVLAWIDSHPERWDQRYFRSVKNGSMCLAGVTCHLAGIDPEQLMVEDGALAPYNKARQLLNLMEHEADLLFLQFVTWGGGRHPTTGELREEIKVVTGWDVDEPDD